MFIPNSEKTCIVNVSHIVRVDIYSADGYYFVKANLVNGTSAILYRGNENECRIFIAHMANY